VYESFVESPIGHTNTIQSGIGWSSDWLIDNDEVRLTSQNRGHHWPIVHPPGECEWRAVVKMMPAGDNSWLVSQSSLAVLPEETSGASIRNGRRSECTYSVLLIHQLIFASRKILRHGTSRFISHPKEDVLRIFITLKNQSSRPGLNQRPLGPVASTLTTTPPRLLSNQATLVLTRRVMQQDSCGEDTHALCRHQPSAVKLRTLAKHRNPCGLLEYDAS
jgi:hypothetical protein